LNNAVAVKNLTKHFKSGGKAIGAVDGISFQLEKGVFAAIIGKSGSGKTTLLNLLGALDQADSGQIEIGDTDITRLRNRKLDEYRRKTVGFIFQSYNLIPNLNALENVMLPMEFIGVPRKERQKRAQELLLSVGIDELRQKHKPTKLSGGEQQRVAIARAIANHPTIILADEPTGNLDTETGHQIVELLKKIAREENTTIIVVTHDTEVARKSQRVLYLRDGKLVHED
jgi:putative ABC transport system ATP-binding protein